jgi:hypothetical protein
MATWDTADLVARCNQLARIPSTTEFPTTADWYVWLTEAQVEWMRELSAHVPEANYCAPTLLVSADSNYTYKFPDPYLTPGSYAPVYAAEIYDRKDGRLLMPGTYWDTGCDYVFEGEQIRFPGGKAKAFTSGPYARYVARPPAISGSQAPVLKPDDARILLVIRAVIKWATAGGMRDPRPYQEMETRTYYGVPERGMVGILASLKGMDTFGGALSLGAQDTPWYKGIDQGGWIP